MREYRSTHCYNGAFSSIQLANGSTTMSLLVNVYTRTPDGKKVVIDPAETGCELAGFESYRQKLYGSQAAQALGLCLLPQLDGGDLYVEGAELEQLRQEAEEALADIERFESETQTTAERLRPRFENIIAATRRAAELGGGIVIW